MKCYKCKQDMKKINDDNYVCEKCGVGSITLKSNTGYFTDIRDAKIADLEKQLAEKDKEIEELKAKLLSKRCWEVVRDIERKSKEFFENPQEQNVMLCSQNDLNYIIRHQVCEEIREKLKLEYTRAENKYWLSMEKVCFVTGYDIFDEFEWEKILDQIEQGESK